MPPASTPVATGNIRWNKMKHPEYILTVLLSMLAVLTGCGKEQPAEEPQGGPQGGQEEPSARPAINKTLKEADGFDTILLGFPIWYGKAPRVVFSFLDTYSFKGKTVIPFITSGSTGISSAASELKAAYPAIVKDLKDADSYDRIYIGFPVWWYTAPTIINTFIETYGFKGKTVIFFATSGGSSIDKANADFKDQYPEIDWKAGKTLNSESKAEIKAWAEGLK